MIVLYLAALAASGQAEGPGATIQRIYAGYAHQHYSPFDHLESIFAPELLAAIREDERLTPKGDAPWLDADPLCDCQDYEKIGAHIRSLTRPTKRSAVATVHITYGIKGEDKDLKLKLALTPRGWRIADIGSPEEPSLLNALLRANREARASH